MQIINYKPLLKYSTSRSSPKSGSPDHCPSPHKTTCKSRLICYPHNKLVALSIHASSYHPFLTRSAPTHHTTLFHITITYILSCETEQSQNLPPLFTPCATTYHFASPSTTAQRHPFPHSLAYR